MDQSELIRTAVVCQGASRMLEEVEAEIFAWASRRTKLVQEFTRYSRKLKEDLEKMPANWVGMAMAQSAMAGVFGNPGTLKKCLAAVRAQLSDEACAFISSFLDNPWRFSFFTVTERHGNDFYTVHDHFAGEDILLQSKSVTTLLRENKHRFFTLLFKNASCWQAYGIVMFLDGFVPEDLVYFARSANPALYEAQGPSAVAIAKPVPFQFLFAYSQMPAVMHGDSPVLFTTSIIPVPDPMAIVLPDENFKEEKNNVLKFAFGGESFFDSIVFYLDIDRKLAILSAASGGKYRDGVGILGPYVQLPPEPQNSISPLVLLAAGKILGLKNPVEYYENLFSEKVPKKETKNLELVNRALRAISVRHNRGEPIKAESFAREFDIPVDLANQMIGILGNMDADMSISLEYRIEGYVPPPPVIRYSMKGSFEHNVLFDLDFDLESTRLYDAKRPGRAGLLSENDLSPIVPLTVFPSQVDDIFEKYWERDDRTLLLYTMYLLRKNGDAYHEAREYASEVLRIFHQAVLPDKDRQSIDFFIRKYSRFIHQVLCPLGLAETGPIKDFKDIRAGTYRLRSTEFFRTWLIWKD